MKTIFHLAAIICGFCITIASSMPVDDAVLKVDTNGDALIKRVSLNGTRINDNDPGGDYTCFGTLECVQTDCSVMIQNMLNACDDAPDYRVTPRQCQEFTNGACVAKFCSNSDQEVSASAKWVAVQLALLNNSCVTQKTNGVMAPCADDSFAGQCAWWQLWLQSEADLITNGNPPGSD